MIFTKIRRHLEVSTGARQVKDNSKAILQLKEEIEELEERIDG